MATKDMILDKISDPYVPIISKTPEDALIKFFVDEEWKMVIEKLK